MVIIYKDKLTFEMKKVRRTGTKIEYIHYHDTSLQRQTNKNKNTTIKILREYYSDIKTILKIFKNYFKKLYMEKRR